MNELERTLIGMSPASSRLDRDALMYSAGHAAASRRRLWPVLAGSFAVLAVGLAIHDATRKRQVIEKVIVVREPSYESPGNGPGEMVTSDRNSYRELERQVLNRGDVLLTYPATAAPPGASRLPSLEKEFDLPPGRLHGLNLSPSS